AILLHDIGHGPFSHALEHSLVEGVHHEDISLLFMEALNDKFNGSLTMAMEIFKGSYPKKFLNQLVSSQLDMDRLDYLKRDSFYTGVAEGNINAERLITMLNVVDGELVVEEKGIYSVEKFLMARRFMYWQVYLHKTGLVAEQLLIHTLRRAKELLEKGDELHGGSALLHFMKTKINKANFDTHALDQFARLDDVDVLAAIKSWQDHQDFVLSNLCNMIINRSLLHVKVKNRPFDPAKIKSRLEDVMEKHQLSDKEAAYFVFSGEIRNTAYNKKRQNILILRDNGKITDVAKASDQLNLNALANTVTKYYLCYPKNRM
ncbi:MAG: phosphohydrolase, partial [Bacteroidota bacterium]